jgi:hypothetical protein
MVLKHIANLTKKFKVAQGGFEPPTPGLIGITWLNNHLKTVSPVS